MKNSCQLLVASCQLLKGMRTAFLLAITMAMLLSLLPTANGQQPTIILKADSNHILIGDFLSIQLTLKYPKELQVTVPKPSENLGDMEVVSESAFDTTIEGVNLLLTKVLVVSAYDSGSFAAGQYKVFFTNSSGNNDSVLSNEIVVAVNTLEVDTTQPFKPIKAPLDVPYTWVEFIYYIIAGVVLLVMAATAFFIWHKNRKPKPVVVERPRPKDAAHVWAKRELKKLEEEKLLQKEEVKLYYSRLSDILRLYLEYRYQWLAVESTTEEIADEVGKYGVNDVAKNLLLDTLRTADLVKFAKMLPPTFENEKALRSVKEFVEITASVEIKPEGEK